DAPHALRAGFYGVRRAEPRPCCGANRAGRAQSPDLGLRRPAPPPLGRRAGTAAFSPVPPDAASSGTSSTSRSSSSAPTSSGAAVPAGALAGAGRRRGGAFLLRTVAAGFGRPRADLRRG